MAQELTKICAKCGKSFTKRPTCSAKDWKTQRYCSCRCHYDAAIGVPSPKRGKTFPEICKRHAENRKYVRCRICKRKTKYTVLHSKNPNANLKHCGRPKCAQRVREIKNERIRKTHLRMYRTGERLPCRTTWSKYPGMRNESPEEATMHDWFVGQGWKSQLLVKTGLVCKHGEPGWYILDFANPNHLLYVEIDGTSHRFKKESDAKRDRILANLGWTGLRVPALLVRQNILRTQAWIRHFIRTHQKSDQATIPE